MIYECLFNLDEKDDFWDNTISGYSKMVCFRDYPNHLDSIDDIKDWFKSQKKHAGRGYCRFLQQWKKNNLDLVAEFQEDFLKKYNLSIKL